MIFSSTAATYGHGRAVVTATGMQTQMGRIADLLKEMPDETTPLQKELDRVGKLLAIIVVIIAMVMIATIILVEHVRGFSAIFEVLILGVALAVAAVPEGLPAMVTAVLSLGLQRMAKKERHHPSSRGGRDAGLNEHHRVRQDRNPDQERDDRARGRYGKWPRDLDGYRLFTERRRPPGRRRDDRRRPRRDGHGFSLGAATFVWRVVCLGLDDDPLCVHGNVNMLTRRPWWVEAQPGTELREHAGRDRALERTSAASPRVFALSPPIVDSTATA